MVLVFTGSNDRCFCRNICPHRDYLARLRNSSRLGQRVSMKVIQFYLKQINDNRSISTRLREVNKSQKVSRIVSKLRVLFTSHGQLFGINDNMW